jgi:hypothetical protein
MSAYLIDPTATSYFHGTAPTEEQDDRFGKMSHIVTDAMEVYKTHKCSWCPEVVSITGAACCAAGGGDDAAPVYCESCEVISNTNKWLRPLHIGGRATVNFVKRRILPSVFFRLSLWFNLIACKMCPTCGMVIERNGGCDHMTCRCGTHFCYVCGRYNRMQPRWDGSCGSQCRSPVFKCFHHAGGK